jgi:LuxR family maltose regulon positive regulatory protein
VAWLALDAADNDPATFLRYLVAALQTIAPQVGATALVLLRTAQPPPLETLITALLNDLAGWGMVAAASLPPNPHPPSPIPHVLVLDDYHVITTSAIHKALAFLIEHLPPHLHLVVATREDPPLPLARWRASGQLSELRVAELRFTPAEVSSFLQETMRLGLSAEACAALDSRTEGWVAGLQLAALAMRGRGDLEQFVAAFTGSNRYVVDYLIEEVFARQPAHIQTFLLRTAILDRMCGSLCDAVLGVGSWELGNEGSKATNPQPPTPNSQSYSQLILDELELRNLFILPLDDVRQWYRYHQLFAEVLRARLQQGANAAELAVLHRRASIWFEQHDLISEAVQHALAGRDFERAAGLVERHGLLVAGRGQSYTLVSWMRALPEAVIRVRPLLCFVDAVRLMNTNQLEDAAARLVDAERSLHTAMPDDQRRAIQGQISLARANLARISGDLAASAAQAQQALALLPETHRWMRAVAALNLARAYQASGDVTAASERRLMEAVVGLRESSNQTAYFMGMASLGRVYALQGRLRRAAETYAEALGFFDALPEMRYLSGMAAWHIGQGALLYEQNVLDDAERHLRQGLDLLEGPVTVDADAILLGATTLARLRQARGDQAGALGAIDLFDQVAVERKIANVLRSHSAVARAWLRLRHGQLAAAAEWAEAIDSQDGDGPLFAYEAEYLTLARVRIAQQRPEQALAVLDRLLQDAETNGRMSSVIEILALQAIALAARPDRAAALAAIGRALALAAPEGYVRIFVDEGAPMAELLRDALRHGVVSQYVRTLLDAFLRTEDRGLRTESQEPPHSALSPQSSALVEPLTPRELEVLRLLAAGASNVAIAETLVISIGTAKKHVNNILGKLDVRSRTQAAIWAREHGLLGEPADA